MSSKTAEELCEEAALANEGLRHAAQDCARQIWDSMERGPEQAAHCIVIVTKIVPDEGSPPPTEPGHRATVLHALGHVQNYGSPRDLIEALHHAARMLERSMS